MRNVGQVELLAVEASTRRLGRAGGKAAEIHRGETRIPREVGGYRLGLRVLATEEGDDAVRSGLRSR